MMLKSFRYLSALAIVGVPLCACSDSIIPGGSDEYTLSGTGEKTPLQIAVTLQNAENGRNTRAINGSFEKNDQLIAYVQQVEVSAGTTPTYTAKISKLVSWTLNEAAISGATTDSNGKMTVTSDNSDGKLGMTLYWDDFSDTTDDIRGDNRRLRVGYGFCYNGSTPTTGLTSSNESSGKIEGWSVQSNQSTADQSNVRKSDLLWAGPQTPIEYKHVVAARQPLPVTYTHAMSKVTIELVLGEGYDVYPNDDANAGKAVAFGSNNTTPTLFANKQVTEADAINQTLKTTVAANGDLGITMYLVEDEKITAGVSNKTRVYEAIIAPTVMKAGKKLAEVTVDGNKYDIVLTNAILETVYPASSGNKTWSSELKGYSVTDNVLERNTGNYDNTVDGNGGVTLSGINYRLVVNLLKQRINVEAKITDWSDVTASTSGIITFNADVKTSTTNDGTEILAGSFDLWRSTTNAEHNSYDEKTSTQDVVDKATTVSYADGKWSCTPAIYWPNGSTNYYFRALANYTEEGDPKVKTLTTVDGSVTANQGKDLVWGTTAKHTGTESDGTTTHNYDEGVAINPRTGNVPLTFYHVMSKITVNLVDENKDATVPAGVEDTDYDNPLNPRIDLTDATIQFTDLATSGTINLKDGSITPASITAGQKLLDVDAGYYSKKNNDIATGITVNVLDEYIVTPQTIGENAMIIITLKDGTVYKAKLADCIVTTTSDATNHAVDSKIGKWLRGKSYTYTISLSKDKITFRALVENWDEVEGGGKATLEWD